MKDSLIVRALLVLAAFFLLYVSVCMGFVAYDLNAQRVEQERDAKNAESLRFSDDGTVIGGRRGPTAMWMVIGGKAVPIRPTPPHVVTLGAISLIAFGGAVGLLWIACGKRNGMAGSRTRR